MKIKNLTVENFKNAPNGTYELKELNVLIGANGRGKTSIQNALRYLLSGNLPEDPIRHGEDHLSVKGVLDDGVDTKIERILYLSDTYRINGEELKEKVFVNEVKKYQAQYEASGAVPMIGKHTNQFFRQQTPDILWKFLIDGKVDGARIFGAKELELDLLDGTNLYIRRSLPSRCVVNGKKVTAKAFSDLISVRMHGDVKSLDIVTSSKVMSAISMADFAKYLIEVVPVTIDFDKMSNLAKLTPEEITILKPLFPDAPNPISVSDVTSVYKILFNTRTDIARQMDDWGKRSIYNGAMPLMDPILVKEKLNGINRAVGAANQLSKNWQVYEKRVHERENSINTLRKWIEEYNAMGKVDPISKDQLDQLLEQERSLNAAIEADLSNNSRMKQINEPLIQMVRNLDSTVCPLCNTLKCTTDKSACRTDLETAIRSNNQMIEDATKRVAENRNRVLSVRAMQDAIRTKQIVYDKKVTLYGRIESLKKTIPEIPAKPDPLMDIAKLQKDGAHYQEYLKQVTLYEECLEASKKYAQFKIQHELYSGLVRKSEPKKGLLTNTILEFILAPFKDHCNQFVKSILGDMAIEFRMEEDGLQVFARPHGRTSFIPVNALSTGEKMLVTFALMDMVSSISNNRMLVFDCLESLDENTLDKLISVLTKQDVLQRYDHIILAMVNHENIQKMIKKYNLFINEISI